MSRIVVPARARLVYVESRGWLLGKLGIKVLVIAGVIFVWGPLVAGRPQAMRLVGWLVWAAIALLALGAVVRVAEAVLGAGCMAYVLSLSLCDTSSRIPADAKPQWEDRIRTAEAKGMEPLVEPTLARWFTAPFRERRKDVVDRVATMIRTTPIAGYVGCCHAISALNLTDRLSAIKLPTIVIVGEDDPGTPVAASRLIAENIKGARLEIISSAAHLSNIEQPEAFNRALSSFLEKVG